MQHESTSSSSSHANDLDHPKIVCTVDSYRIECSLVRRLTAKSRVVIVGDPCQIVIYRTETGYLFRVMGRGTLRESPAVRDFVCGALEDGADVLLDLSACEHLDSTFLGCLVMMHQRGESSGGSFALLADPTTRQNLLGTSRLDQILPFAEQRPPLIGAPVALQITKLERKEFCQHLLDTHRQLADLGGPAADTFRGIVEQLTKEL